MSTHKKQDEGLRDQVSQTFWGTSYEQTPQSEQGRVDQVVALITQYANEARIEGALGALKETYLFTDGLNDEGREQIKRRITELEQESKS